MPTIWHKGHPLCSVSSGSTRVGSNSLPSDAGTNKRDGPLRCTQSRLKRTRWTWLMMLTCLVSDALGQHPRGLLVVLVLPAVSALAPPPGPSIRRRSTGSILNSAKYRVRGTERPLCTTLGSHNPTRHSSSRSSSSSRSNGGRSSQRHAVSSGCENPSNSAREVLSRQVVAGRARRMPRIGSRSAVTRSGTVAAEAAGARMAQRCYSHSSGSCSRAGSSGSDDSGEVIDIALGYRGGSEVMTSDAGAGARDGDGAGEVKEKRRVKGEDLNMADIVKFGASTLAIWSFNPLMSLIDTAVIAWSGSSSSSGSSGSRSLGAAWSGMLPAPLRHMLYRAMGGYAGRARPDPSLLAVQLAAMGPATVTCDIAVYLFSFIGVYATTQLASAVAAAAAEARAASSSSSSCSSSSAGEWNDAGTGGTRSYTLQRLARRQSQISRIRSEALTVALVCGLGILLFTEVLGPILIRASQPAAVVPHASAYVVARGLALPFAVVAAVAQALCLGARDVYTPILSTAVACALNVVGDVVLIWGFNMGCLGAAIATAVAEAVACVVLLRSIAESQRGTCSNLRGLQRVQEQEMVAGAEPVSTSIQQHDRSDGDAGRAGGLFVRMSPREVFAYVATASPVFLALCGRTLSQAVVAYSVAYCDTAGMAAHQVLMRIRLLFAVFGDAFSQTALSLLSYAANGNAGSTAVLSKGDASTSPNSRETSAGAGNVAPASAALRQFAARFILFAATVASLVGAGALLMATRLNRLFTPDEAIRSRISAAPVSLLLGGTVALHALSMALEGALMALHELPFVSFMSLANVISIATVLYIIVGRTDAGTLPLQSVWRAAGSLEAALALQYGLRLLWRLTATRPPRTTTPPPSQEQQSRAYYATAAATTHASEF